MIERFHYEFGANFRFCSLGLIEKALFYEEYEAVDRGESSIVGTVFVAELVSVAKRSLARILVIIVSLGYGIVK